MIIAAVLVFLWIDLTGTGLFPMAPNTGAPSVAALKQFDYLLHVLLALVVVIIVARVVGGLFKYMHQPPVIGEVIGGIMLGPSLLGRLAPDIYAYVLPTNAAPFLGVIAQLGVILYMFLVGLELDLKIIRNSGHAALAISHASIVAPFLLGSGLALWIYPNLAPHGISFTSFALFLGVSMSVTAFPVLARILTDKKLNKTTLGAVALTCAAIDDITAWCLLALVISVVQSTIPNAISTVGLTLVYIVIMFVVVKPIIKRGVLGLEHLTRVSESEMAVIFVSILLSALATELIGIHAIFGAFLLGVIIPHDSRAAHDLTHRLDDMVRILFLPAFFAFTGMRTQVGLLNSFDDWAICGVIIVVATIGKFGGTWIAAKLSGLSWRDSTGLGILMNTRGLVELIVLNIGLDLGVISPRLFTMLVIMALATTFMAGPALALVIDTKNITPAKPQPQTAL